MALSGDPHARALLRFLLEAACEPYLEMLSSWLGTGRVDDPHREFMVEEYVCQKY